MNATEKLLRRQALQKIRTLEHSGAKPETIEKLQESVQGKRRTNQSKGKAFFGVAPRRQ